MDDSQKDPQTVQKITNKFKQTLSEIQEQSLSPNLQPLNEAVISTKNRIEFKKRSSSVIAKNPVFKQGFNKTSNSFLRNNFNTKSGMTIHPESRKVGGLTNKELDDLTDGVQSMLIER